MGYGCSSRYFIFNLEIGVNMQHLQNLQIVSVVFIILLINGCATQNAPAPVIDIGTAGDAKIVDKALRKGKYQVKSGDTLFSIAWYTGKDYRELAAINKIPPPYKIFAGQIISLKNISVIPKAKTPINGGLTTQSKGKSVIDPPKKQAYGENAAKKKAFKTSTNRAVKAWGWPTQGKLISRYSLTEDGNKGIDIANKRGTSILAAADGKVIYTGSALRGFGKLVIVKHSENFLSAYAHNEEIVVKEQQTVKKGQIVARMGNSGSKKVKLHFEIRFKGKSVDPLRYLPPKGS